MLHFFKFYKNEQPEREEPITTSTERRFPWEFSLY